MLAIISAGFTNFLFPASHFSISRFFIISMSFWPVSLSIYLFFVVFSTNLHTYLYTNMYIHMFRCVCVFVYKLRFLTILTLFFQLSFVGYELGLPNLIFFLSIAHLTLLKVIDFLTYIDCFV